MRVICINNKNYPLSLYLNKEYEVVRVEEFFYVILDETLEEYLYPIELFEISKD
jgi:hypothetical protein